METEMKTLSQLIAESMRRAGLDVERLGRLTGISERFIGALLEEKLNDLPSAPYVRGYLKRISEVLNLNGEEIWRVYLKDRQEIRRSGEKDKLPANRFAASPLLKRPVVIIILLILVLLVYFLLRSGTIFGQTEINFIGLGESYVVSPGSEFVIRGTIEPLASLTMNGTRLYPDEEGYFEVKVQLQPGLNTFEFKVAKFLGEEKTIVKQIFYGQ